MSDKKYPTWMRKECFCLFCYTHNEPTKIEIIEHPEGKDGRAVRVEHTCANPNCRSRKRNPMAIVYPMHAECYERFVRKNGFIIKEKKETSSSNELRGE
jgi:hypothetical protein